MKKEKKEEYEYECVRCGAAVKADDKVCPKCGDNLQEEVIKEDATFDKLIENLKSSDWEVRFDAVKALRKIKDQRAVEPLRAIVNDSDSDIREEASKALDEITGNSPASTEDMPILSAKLSFTPSEIRKIGLKNMKYCAAWVVFALFLFLSRLWFTINNLLQIPSEVVAGMVSGPAMALVPLLKVAGMTLGMSLLIGWVFPLLPAMIMSTTGYYPHLLRRLLIYKPEDELSKRHLKSKGEMAQ